MSVSTFDELLAARQRVASIIWLGFMAALGVYAVVAFAVPQVTPVGAQSLNTALIGVFALFACLAGVGSVYLKRWLLSQQRLTVLLSPDAAERFAQGSEESISHISQEQLASLSEDERPLYAVAATYMVAFLASCACSEAVAIVGLLAAILYRVPALYFAFAAPALLLLAYHRPDVRGAVEAVKRGGPF
jgi:hypothetical protein